MDTVYTALVFPPLLLIGQTLVALGQRKISQRMDEGQAKTDAKRAAEAEWRAHGGHALPGRRHHDARPRRLRPRRLLLRHLDYHHVAVGECG